MERRNIPASQISTDDDSGDPGRAKKRSPLQDPISEGELFLDNRTHQLELSALPTGTQL
jgi:hypothetical protein